MANDSEPSRPVQVFLDTSHFIGTPETLPSGGGKRDFFEGDNQGFKVHKERICARLHGISQTLRDQKDPVGFIHVQVREEALAKSHRPIGSLFREAHEFQLVGGGNIGEMVFQATSRALDRLEQTIVEKAELTPRQTIDVKGKTRFRVSGYRSEVGSITEVSLHSAANRVTFSVEEAVAWLAQSSVMGRSYLVELFRPQPANDPSIIFSLLDSLQDSLNQLPSGIIVHPFLPREVADHLGEPPLAFSVQLSNDPEHKEIMLPSFDGKTFTVYKQDRQSAANSKYEDTDLSEINLAPEHHQLLLKALTEHPLVRKVELPPTIEAYPASASAQSADPSIPSPANGRDYPTVGIIDGGVANIPSLETWRTSGADICHPKDRDEAHGTFIAGLVAAGATLNPHIANKLEPQGCMFFDLDIFPRKDLRQYYYDRGPDYFFDLLDEKIKFAKQNYAVRIFNFSFCLNTPNSYGYSLLADRLDRIARANDVVLVISAGNLFPGQNRPPWPAEALDVTAMLAAISIPQQITSPAEHLLGLTIGAINPPGVEGHEPEVPTTYTRRGPGTGRARKPDLAHFGGIEPSTATRNRTALASLAPSGDRIERYGTSFACPNASAMLATLDHRLEHAQPREVLLALSVHRASRADVLNEKNLLHIARDFVGYGLPPPADTLLVDTPSKISLVFDGTLLNKQHLEFMFAWPAELTDQLGRCRGQVNLTLAFTPPIDQSYQDEAMRVQLDASLHQETINHDASEPTWENRLRQDGSGLPQGMNMTERYMLKAGLKWSPIKHYS